MSSLWDTVFIQAFDRTGPLMLNLSETPYTSIWTPDLGTKPKRILFCKLSNILMGFHGDFCYPKRGRLLSNLQTSIHSVDFFVVTFPFPSRSAYRAFCWKSVTPFRCPMFADTSPSATASLRASQTSSSIVRLNSVPTRSELF
jgi:hypothetical protein